MGIAHPSSNGSHAELPTPNNYILNSGREIDDLLWQENALCATTNPDAFFPERGGSTREAKLVCNSCEVKAQCLDYALENDEKLGVWGGMSEKERETLAVKYRLLGRTEAPLLNLNQVIAPIDQVAGYETKAPRKRKSKLLHSYLSITKLSLYRITRDKNQMTEVGFSAISIEIDLDDLPDPSEFEIQEFLNLERHWSE